MTRTTVSWTSVSASASIRSHRLLYGTHLAPWDRSPLCWLYSWQSRYPCQSSSHALAKSADEAKATLDSSSVILHERGGSAARVPRVLKMAFSRKAKVGVRSRVVGVQPDRLVPLADQRSEANQPAPELEQVAAVLFARYQYNPTHIAEAHEGLPEIVGALVLANEIVTRTLGHLGVVSLI